MTRGTFIENEFAYENAIARNIRAKYRFFQNSCPIRRYIRRVDIGSNLFWIRKPACKFTGFPFCISQFFIEYIGTTTCG